MKKLLFFSFVTSLFGLLYLSVIWGYLIFSGKNLIIIGDYFTIVLILEFFCFIISIPGLIIAIKKEFE